VRRIELGAPPAVANFLLNHRRAAIAKIEVNEQKQIIIRPDETCPADKYNVICFDEREGIVKI
jgi:Ribonuclease G/E